MRTPENYPQFMMAEAEREAEDAAFAAGYPKPVPAYMRAFWQTLRAHRAAERIAAGNGSFVDYVCVAAREEDSKEGES